MKQIRSAIIVFLSLILLTGLIYPLLVTGLAQAIFPHQANGSIISREEEPVGSALIGQPFSDPKYFWGRPSATSGEPYNASASGGSNYSPMNPALVKEVQERVDALTLADPDNQEPIPVDLVTSSGSGLDPDISVAAAEYQAARVAKARGISVDQVYSLIQQYTHERILGLLGEKTINVLEINLALDELQ